VGRQVHAFKGSHQGQGRTISQVTAFYVYIDPDFRHDGQFHCRKLSCEMDKLSTVTPLVETRTNLATADRIVIPNAVIMSSPLIDSFDELVQLHESLDTKTKAKLAIALMMDLLVSMIALQLEADQARWKQRFIKRVDTILEQCIVLIDKESMEKGE